MHVKSYQVFEGIYSFMVQCKSTDFDYESAEDANS